MEERPGKRYMVRRSSDARSVATLVNLHDAMHDSWERPVSAAEMTAGVTRTAHEQEEAREKGRVTIISVAAAVVLTALKLVVGLATGSLGLLSEAAHSGLDTVASVLTFISVRIAGRPADEDHPYGHGRVENLSATVQGLLLLLTAGAILYESVRRIFFVAEPVEPSPWTFAVMAASIGVDIWRSRLLSRAARRYHSRALEADALNFRADLFSSSVVILGLAFTTYAELTGRGGVLLKADAVAALVVGLVIIRMSGSLALRAVHVMLDRAPVDLRAALTKAAASVPGVMVARPVRVRESGHRVFADVVVTTPRTTSLVQAHEITERVERALRDVEPRAETVVHIEPMTSAAESAADAIRAVALQLGVATHHEQVYETPEGLEAALHVEVEPALTLEEAHAEAHRLADAILAEDPRLSRVDTHIEVAVPYASRRREVGAEHPEMVSAIRRAVEAGGDAASVREVRLYEEALGTGWDVALCCTFGRDLTMAEVHVRTERIEQLLRERVSDIVRVVVHAEPVE